MAKRALMELNENKVENFEIWEWRERERGNKAMLTEDLVASMWHQEGRELSGNEKDQSWRRREMGIERHRELCDDSKHHIWRQVKEGSKYRVVYCDMAGQEYLVLQENDLSYDLNVEKQVEMTFTATPPS